MTGPMLRSKKDYIAVSPSHMGYGWLDLISFITTQDLNQKGLPRRLLTKVLSPTYVPKMSPMHNNIGLSKHHHVGPHDIMIAILDIF